MMGREREISNDHVRGAFHFRGEGISHNTYLPHHINTNPHGEEK